MKTANIERKISSIEESMKPLRIKGTRIDWNCLTHEERTLFGKVWELKEEYSPSSPPDDVLEENHGLLIKGIELLMRRAIDLFQEATKIYCMVDDDESFFELVYTLRVYWFLYEMRRQFERNKAEEELLDRYEDDEEFEQAHKEYVESLEDKTALWSRESFEKFTRPVFDSGLRKKRKRRR
jgi:hypothetical protein